MLQDMPSGFVSVSLTAAEKDEELRAETRRIMDEFVKDLELTDWDAVDRFARDFVARARRRTQERSPGGTTSTGRGAG